MNGANALYVNVSFAADVLDMHINSHVICKMESEFFAIVENMTLCPNEREVQLKFCVHIFRRMKRHSVFSSFNCSVFSIIQCLI